MKTFIKKLDKALEIVVIALMGILVIDVLWQVFSRFILSDPSSFTDELARFLLIWLSLFGGAYMLGKKQHLAIDLITHRLNERQVLYLDTVVQSVILVFVIAVLIVGGSRLVFVTLYLNQTSAALGIELGYVYAVIPLSGLIMCLYCIHFLVENVAGINKMKSQQANSGD